MTVGIIFYEDIFYDNGNQIEKEVKEKKIFFVKDVTIAERNETKDINAEMLIAIPDRMPSPYLVPPPFPPPLSVLIKRRPSYAVASRRYFEDPRPFHFTRKHMSRVPVNSIQDILNQMERESTDFERVAHKKPKRINFYGKYRHRPNRPKVIPILYGNAAPPVRENNPSVANDVNHLITQNQVPQREPTQLFYPSPGTSDDAMQSNGLYDQIIATNKQRQETARDAKPFSLMLDIYPMTENQTTTAFPPPPPPQLPPLQIDHSYYNSIKFPQIHPTHSANQYEHPVGTAPPPSEQPEKMVVHLNLYPTKKNQKSNNRYNPETQYFINQPEEDSFMPIINPQIYYRSRSAEDESNQATIQGLKRHGDVIDIPKRARTQTGAPSIQMVDHIHFGPAVNISDYRTTIPPHIINKFLYGEETPKFTYLGQFNSNEIGRRVDVQLESTTISPESTSKAPPSRNYQRNSHQPDNPMIVENLAQYIGRSAMAEKP